MGEGADGVRHGLKIVRKREGKCPASSPGSTQTATQTASSPGSIQTASTDDYAWSSAVPPDTRRSLSADSRSVPLAPVLPASSPGLPSTSACRDSTGFSPPTRSGWVPVQESSWCMHPADTTWLHNPNDAVYLHVPSDTLWCEESSHCGKGQLRLQLIAAGG